MAATPLNSSEQIEWDGYVQKIRLASTQMLSCIEKLSVPLGQEQKSSLLALIEKQFSEIDKQLAELRCAMKVHQ